MVPSPLIYRIVKNHCRGFGLGTIKTNQLKSKQIALELHREDQSKGF